MEISEEQGKFLVRIARETIAGEVGIAYRTGELPDDLLKAPALQQNLGVFVTLHKQGQLRGCIGSLSSSRPIVEGVKNNAVNAAFRDHRFSPVTREEFDLLDIEVSVLSEPLTLDYKDVDDLLGKLRQGIDGVIIKKGGASATFLPQVWKQLPDKAKFLSHLCQKAGLMHDQWQQGDLEIKVYQVQYFVENKG